MGNDNAKRLTGRHLSGQDKGPFVPYPLPPSPSLQMTDEITTLLSRADRAVARLDGATGVLPNPDLFVYMFARKEAVDSSKIEGTQATLTDVLKAEAKLSSPDIPADVEEARAYISAMNKSLGRMVDIPLSLRLIKLTHESLLSEVSRGSDKMPGEFRRTQVWIGPEGGTIGEATFIPPPPGPELEKCLGDLENFIHQDHPIPVLIRAGMIHAQFETIHPFLDGNGRVGRMLITLFLCQQGVLERPLLYLSTYFKNDTAAYYRRLQQVRVAGDWEGWLAYFLEGIALTANSAAEKAKKIVQLREQDRGHLIAEMGKGAASGLAVLESLYELPLISITDAAEIAGVTYNAGSKLIHQMERLGIIREITREYKNRRYLYDAYVSLFHDA